jgi:hypothetical protein
MWFRNYFRSLAGEGPFHGGDRLISLMAYLPIGFPMSIPGKPLILNSLVMMVNQGYFELWPS